MVQEDRDMIALAASVADVQEKAQTTGVMVIPRVAVLKQTKLTSSCPLPASKRKRLRTSAPP